MANPSRWSEGNAERLSQYRWLHGALSSSFSMLLAWRAPHHLLEGVTLSVRLRRILLILGCALLLASCIRDPVPPSVRAQLRLAQLDGTDLPSGWGNRSSKLLEVAGGYGQIVGFHGADPTRYSFVLVSQTLEIFGDISTSRAAFASRVERAIPAAEAWVVPSELRFGKAADESRIACMAVEGDSIPMRSCRAVARYGQIVMTVYGNVFRDRWITMPQFQRLLERLEQRAYEASSGSQDRDSFMIQPVSLHRGVRPLA